MTLPGGASGTGSKTRSQSGSTRMYVSAYSGNGRPGAVPATGPALAYAWTGCREPPLRPFVTGAKPRARRCSMTEERPTEWPRSAAVAVSCKATKSDFPQLPGVLSLLRGCPDLTRKGSWMSITFDQCASAALRKILDEFLQDRNCRLFCMPHDIPRPLWRFGKKSVCFVGRRYRIQQLPRLGRTILPNKNPKPAEPEPKGLV